MNIELNKNDRICFLGDSITMHGMWIKEILQYFADNYPGLKIGCYNCGIAGATSGEANLKNRLYYDCFNFFPKYVIVKFGMNDTDISLYSPNCKDKNKEEKKKEKLQKYKENMENIISLCKQNDIIPILCTPTPYDEYTKNDESENLYADLGLRACRKIVIDLAQKNNLKYIDMHDVLSMYMEDKPIGDDRVHPNEYGHHLMAEEFLRFIGAKAEFEPYKKCVISEANQQRFDIEQKYRLLCFIEQNIMGWQNTKTKTVAHRKRLLRAKMRDESPENKTFKESFDYHMSFYLDNIDFKEEILGELIRKTKQIYF